MLVIKSYSTGVIKEKKLPSRSTNFFNKRNIKNRLIEMMNKTFNISTLAAGRENILRKIKITRRDKHGLFHIFEQTS